MPVFYSILFYSSVEYPVALYRLFLPAALVFVFVLVLIPVIPFS